MAARIGVVIALLLGLLYLCTFRVYEYQHAILLQLGKIQRSDYEPGLHFLIRCCRTCAASTNGCRPSMPSRSAS